MKQNSNLQTINKFNGKYNIVKLNITCQGKTKICGVMNDSWLWIQYQHIKPLLSYITLIYEIINK